MDGQTFSERDKETGDRAGRELTQTIIIENIIAQKKNFNLPGMDEEDEDEEAKAEELK